MKVWIVEGDTRYYDEGSTWVEGVFSTEEKAEQASKDAHTKYYKDNGPNPFLDVEFYHYEMEVQ